jgi:hypothetical protein
MVSIKTKEATRHMAATGGQDVRNTEPAVWPASRFGPSCPQPCRLQITAQRPNLGTTKPRLSVGAYTAGSLVLRHTGPFGLAKLCHSPSHHTRAAARKGHQGTSFALKFAYVLHRSTARPLPAGPRTPAKPPAINSECGRPFGWWAKA